MGGVELFMLAGMAVCVLSEGFFSGSELAIVSADRGKLRRKAEAGHRGAKLALALLASPDRLLTATLLGTCLSLVGSATLANELAARLVSTRLAAVSAIVMVPIVLIAGEILPKALLRQRADAVVTSVVYPIAAVERALLPLVAALSFMVRAMTQVFRRAFGLSTPPPVTREELALMVKMEEGRGFSTAEEAELIRRLLQMSDRRVREVMVPVADIVSAPASTPPVELARIVCVAGFSRVFVYDGSMDNIKGFVHAMDLLAHDPQSSDSADRMALVKDVTFIPEQARLESVLRDFLEHHREVAVVVDEYGATTGLLSLEDIIEVIVGQISDEFDRARGPEVQEVTERKFVVDARLHLDELAHRGVTLPEEEPGVATVSGLLMHLAQRVPKNGESFVVGNARLQVLAATDRRIRKVLVEILEREAT